MGCMGTAAITKDFSALEKVVHRERRRRSAGGREVWGRAQGRRDGAGDGEAQEKPGAEEVVTVRSELPVRRTASERERRRKDASVT